MIVSWLFIRTAIKIIPIFECDLFYKGLLPLAQRGWVSAVFQPGTGLALKSRGRQKGYAAFRRPRGELTSLTHLERDLWMSS